MLSQGPSRHRSGRWTTANPKTVPARPGTYALFSGDQLLYIGSSTDLRGRLKEHGYGARWSSRPRKHTATPRLRVKIAESRRPGDWLAREYRLIVRLRPPLNRVHAHR